MRKSTLMLFVRVILQAGALLGALLIVVSLLPYETLASLLNKLAADGKLDSFTQAGYQAFSRWSLLVGIVLIVLECTLLIWWTCTREHVGKLIFRLRNFNRLLRRDAPVLFRDFSPALMSNSDIWLVCGLVLLALVVRLANLFIPIEFDEAYTYNAFASRSLWHTITDYHMPNNHVLSTIFINIVVHLVGNQLWMLRVPSLVVGVFMIPVCYLLARRLYGKDAAALGSLFVAVFPVIVKFSVLARGYILISLCTVMIFLLGDYVRENKNRLAWLLLIVFSALGLYTIPIMLYSFGALYVWLFLAWLFGDTATYRTRFDFLKYWLAGGVTTTFLTIALYLPIFLNKSNPLAKNQFLTPVGWDAYSSLIWLKLKDTWLDWTSPIPGWMVSIGVFGLLLSLMLHHKIARQKIPTQAAFFVWMVGFIVLRRPIMEVRMWTFLAAPLLIWSAGGLMGALKMLLGHLNVKWQPSPIYSNVILVFVLVLSVSTLRTIPERWAQKGNIENAVLYLKSHLKAGDLVAASTAFRPQLQYYFVIYEIPSTYLRSSGTFDRAFVLVRSVARSANAGDTLEMVAPRTAVNVPAIDMATAKVVQQYEDLTLYESYPYP